MKKDRVPPLTIIAAQISNDAAEKASGISIVLLIILMIFSVCVLSYSFIAQRVTQSLGMADAALYPGFGAALKALGSQSGSFQVNGGVLEISDDFPRRLESSGWIILSGSEHPSDALEAEKSGSYMPVFVLGVNGLIISQPLYSVRLSAPWKTLGLFSSAEIKKASVNTDSFVTYIQAFLFSASTAEVPSAILTLLLLMTVQYLFFILVASFLLSISHIRSMKGTSYEKRTSFLSSIKILSVVGILPALIVALTAAINPSFGITFGWILYSLVTGIRAVSIYMKRMKSRPVTGL
ncbi:MAG: hypothetical protein KA785_00120 [Spirochaetaceae bacterium]|jgi:hypothetical protein|nr:hypothetical protein [Spirochaetaceae bacterium]